jgi:hypothetical protein
MVLKCMLEEVVKVVAVGIRIQVMGKVNTKTEVQRRDASMGNG